MKKITNDSRLSAAAAVVVGTLMMGLVSAYALTTTGNAFADSAPVVVTIEGFMNGVPATALNAASIDFPMRTTYVVSGIPGGPSEFALSASGYNGNPTPYVATTSGLMTGDTYTVWEDVSGSIGLMCNELASTSPRYALVGYTSGATRSQAAAATPTLSIPVFDPLASDRYVIVWNRDCTVAIVPPVVPPVATSTVIVTIDKMIDGVHASATNASSTSFAMNASWAASTLGTSTGQFTLGAQNTPTPYQAQTVAMDSGAQYSASEVIDGALVGVMCSTTNPLMPRFSLMGYTSGSTFAAAASGTPSMTAPVLTGLTSSAYVIVWNHDCSKSAGQIGGDVTGDGSNGTLAVTSVDAVDTSALSDGTFEHGWTFVFNITAPTSEQDLSMKFADWVRAGGAGSMTASSTVRISSAQAATGTPVLVLGPGIYTSPALHLIGDLSSTTPGRQVQVTVSVQVPVGTPDGSYTTSYGVRTN